MAHHDWPHRRFIASILAICVGLVAAGVGAVLDRLGHEPWRWAWGSPPDAAASLAMDRIAQAFTAVVAPLTRLRAWVARQLRHDLWSGGGFVTAPA